MAEGDEIIITNGGRPAARLVPVQPPSARQFGFDQDVLEVPEQLDDPLDPNLISAFER